MATWKGIVGSGFSASDFDSYVKQLTFGAWRPQFVVVHNTQIPSLASWKKAPGTKCVLTIDRARRIDATVVRERKDVTVTIGKREGR